jgi:hypothetical protein
MSKRPTTAFGWHARAAMHVLEALDWQSMYFVGPFAATTPRPDQWIEDHARVSLEAAHYATFQAESIELEAGEDVFPGHQ